MKQLWWGTHVKSLTSQTRNQLCNNSASRTPYYFRQTVVRKSQVENVEPKGIFRCLDSSYYYEFFFFIFLLPSPCALSRLLIFCMVESFIRLTDWIFPWPCCCTAWPSASRHVASHASANRASAIVASHNMELSLTKLTVWDHYEPMNFVAIVRIRKPQHQE